MSSLVEFDVAGRSVRIEHAWVGPMTDNTPLIVFLHEGLGSLALWKDFPERLCQAAGWPGLVYSRPGYGRSTPRPHHEHWAPDFMHRQAHDVLPSLLAALNVQRPVWLFGHSDGGSIALLYAAQRPTAGVITLAAHVMVEQLCLASIAQAKTAYETTDLKQRLAKYHDDPDSAFWGWNRIWLDPAFARWSIESDIEAIRCPLLAVQGVNDEYGTMAQMHSISRHVPQAELLELADCAHSPHKDQPQRLMQAATDFFRRHR